MTHTTSRLKAGVSHPVVLFNNNAQHTTVFIEYRKSQLVKSRHNFFTSPSRQQRRTSPLVAYIIRTTHKRAIHLSTGHTELRRVPVSHKLLPQLAPSTSCSIARVIVVRNRRTTCMPRQHGEALTITTRALSSDILLDRIERKNRTC